MKIYKALARDCDFSYLFIFSCYPLAATNVILTVQAVLWDGSTAFFKATINLSLLTAHLRIHRCGRAGSCSLAALYAVTLSSSSVVWQHFSKVTQSWMQRLWNAVQLVRVTGLHINNKVSTSPSLEQHGTCWSSWWDRHLLCWHPECFVQWYSTAESG